MVVAGKTSAFQLMASPLFAFSEFSSPQAQDCIVLRFRAVVGSKKYSFELTLFSSVAQVC